MDTIFAQATVPGRSGVAVIRISGPAAFKECRALVSHLPQPRQPSLRAIRRADGDVLDQALVLCFADGHSFTGEKVVEIQSHGSIAVVKAILAELSSRPGLRPAEAGEFTRRALDNERLDLTQVEGLADLIDAETETQRLLAQRVFSGELRQRVDAWRRLLIEASALLEATLDFSDEDVPVDVYPDVRENLSIVAGELRAEIAGFGASERIRTGFEVAILGPPNIGKSTLINTIARRNVSLTSEIEGTTRDIIELRTDLNGLPVTFLDTAGLRETSDPLENAGVELALQRALDADLRVYLTQSDITPIPMDAGDPIVVGKSDLQAVPGTTAVSGLTGDGVESLLKTIGEILGSRIARGSIAIRDRHRTAILFSMEHLSAAQELLEERMESELVADRIRSASNALCEVIGRVDVDDLLDDIFSRFCIGK